MLTFMMTSDQAVDVKVIASDLKIFVSDLSVPAAVEVNGFQERVLIQQKKYRHFQIHSLGEQQETRV